MTRPLRVLGLAGSLRSDSHNRALLHAAARLAGPGVELDVFEGLKGIPVFDEDLEADTPPAVAGLRRAVGEADAVLFATPEYNQSMPGVVKNLVDWLSRGGAGLADKPVAVIGASTGPWGTRIAQSQLRHVLLAVGALVVPAPALYVAHAASRFDERGVLIDADLAERLADVVGELAGWARRLGGELAPEADVSATLVG
ncbi:NADPH-dependent FMN reductase [Streptomyces sp. NPDC020983]|uniref:NADPH-dependent FMN reductase n=1 Tax=Streptomyces sp. NPDC020983 TaxID=3365106 RepID=UPI00378FF7BE